MAKCPRRAPVATLRSTAAHVDAVNRKKGEHRTGRETCIAGRTHRKSREFIDSVPGLQLGCGT